MKMPKIKLFRKLFGSSDVKTITEKIKMLGDSAKFDTNTFIFMRLFTTVLFFFILIFIFNLGYILSPFLAIVYYYAFYYVLIESPLKKRIIKLDGEALHFFEILTLTLESGKNLENALKVKCFNIDSELLREFKKKIL